ncbi:MAG: hypothetical protein E6H66_04935 [Betaproteobacteria bacterium]|nr:MAG: hypothetical protein E6H66_04935 [Betaproteobacteria bacterium]
MGKTEEKGIDPRGLTAPMLAFCALLLQPAIATADPAAKVHLPTVVQGETEFELLGGYQWWRNNEDNRLRQFIGEVGYGVTSWWKTELGAGTTRLPNESYKLDEIEWENIFALTEPGQYWLDLGLFVELAHDHPDGRNAIAIGPMFQKEIESMQANLNVFFERELGAGADPGAAVNYEWQLKWRGDRRFEPGVQGFGTLGTTNNFGHETASRIGPALFGQVSTGLRSKFKYDAAVMFGLNNNTPNTTLRFQIEYELN